MTPFDDKVPPISDPEPFDLQAEDPLSLAHRQLQDATDREMRLLARITQLEEQNRIYTAMMVRHIQQQQVPYVVPRYQSGLGGIGDCTMARGNLLLNGDRLNLAASGRLVPLPRRSSFLERVRNYLGV